MLDGHQNLQTELNIDVQMQEQEGTWSDNAEGMIIQWFQLLLSTLSFLLLFE